MESPNTLVKVLAFQEGINASLSPRDDDSLTPVDTERPEAKKVQEIVDMLDLVR